MAEPTATPQPTEQKHSTPDGPRFVASLQDVKNKCLYKDFFESEKLGETKLRAQEAMEGHKRKVIIFDRVEHEIIERLDPEAPEEDIPEESSQPKKRGRKAKK